MTLKVFRSSVAKLCGPLHVARSGVWKVIARVRIWKIYGTPPTQGWRDLYVVGSPPATPPPAPPPPPPPPPITLNVTAAPASGSGTRVGQGQVYTGVITLTPSNGTAPYTYTWSRVSYSGSIIPTILQDTVYPNKVQFGRNMLGTVPETETARFQCLVQDSLGNIGYCYVDTTFTTTLAPSGSGGTGGGGYGGGGGGINVNQV